MDATIETDRVRDWKVEQFLRLGFDAEQAERMAELNADHHEAERLIRNGCPVSLVDAILN